MVFGVMVLSAFSTVFTEFWHAASITAAANHPIRHIFFMAFLLILI